MARRTFRAGGVGGRGEKQIASAGCTHTETPDFTSRMDILRNEVVDKAASIMHKKVMRKKGKRIQQKRDERRLRTAEEDENATRDGGRMKARKTFRDGEVGGRGEKQTASANCTHTEITGFTARMDFLQS